MVSMFHWYEVPFALGFDEWDKWHADTKKRHPFQYFARWTLPIFCSYWWRQLVTDPWYNLKCRLWHRYNVVVCRDLPPTWNDRRTLVVYASFQLLKDFIDKEKPWEFSATPSEMNEAYGGHRKKDWETIRELYDWWEKRKGSDKEDDDEDDKMLRELISVRKLLWT